MEKHIYEEMAEHEEKHWWYAARRKILTQLLTPIRLLPNPAILDIGTGTGGNWLWLNRFGKVTALERNPDARAFFFNKTGQHAVEGSLPDAIPLAETFDMVCMFDVLEHIEHEVPALQRVRDLLAETGHLIITVPAYPFLWSLHDQQCHHYRRYTRHHLLTVLNQAGFTCTRMTSFNTLLFPCAVITRLLDRNSSKKCSTGFQIPAAWLNTLFEKIFSLEAKWLKYWNFPFGVSIYVQCVKTRDSDQTRL